MLLIGILLGGSAGAAIAVSLAAVGIANPDGLEPAMYILARRDRRARDIVRAERLNAFVRTGFVVAVANVVVLTAFDISASAMSPPSSGMWPASSTPGSRCCWRSARSRPSATCSGS